MKTTSTKEVESTGLPKSTAAANDQGAVHSAESVITDVRIDAVNRCTTVGVFCKVNLSAVIENAFHAAFLGDPATSPSRCRDRFDCLYPE
jgi:hypothetical protein